MIDFSKEHKTLLSRLAKNPNDMEARTDLLRCNCLWAEDYDIQWRSPSQMNPKVLFD